MESDIESAIRKGAAFLKRKQNADGSFDCLTSEVFDEYKDSCTVPAIVPVNMVLSSLGHIPETPVIHHVKKKAAAFLLRERSAHWSFNYWFRRSEAFRTIPYPDDLDDTFCALAALHEYDAGLFDGDALGKIVTMLAAAEIDEGGPYNMWLVPRKSMGPSAAWRDVDLVVNSNIGYFLSRTGVRLPKLDAYIEQTIDRSGYEFPYNTIYPGIYFISRFYRGERVSRMIRLLLSKRRRGRWENPLRTALAVSALLNFSDGAQWRETRAGVRFLLDTQSAAGGWEPYSFFFQMRTKEKTLYAGDASITTALALEALHAFAAAQEKHRGRMPSAHKAFSITERRTHRKEARLAAAIVRTARKRFGTLAPELREGAVRTLEATLHGRKANEIILLPFFFRKTLGRKAELISDTFLVQLGLANLCGWMAYAILDDFLDADGDPRLLPVAEVCMRDSYRGFAEALWERPGWNAFVRGIFDRIDEANCWEARHCRVKNIDAFLASGRKKLPAYGTYAPLADRSLGHVLGPAAILWKLGYGKRSKELRSLMAFCTHYLIARQLDDDAHDWQEDLERGLLTAVLVRLLENPKSKRRSRAELCTLFWDESITDVIGDIRRELARAKRALAGNSLLKDPGALLKLLQPIEASVSKTETERAETKKFLRSYGS